MADGRPPKEGLDFAGWETGVLDNDTKLDRLIEAQGIAAFTVYFYLCQHAYATHGYYLDWSYSSCATTARKLGKGASADFVKEVVDMCFQCGLFDKGLFDKYEILTSRGIQRRYWKAIKKRVSKAKIKKFWLLDENEESQSFNKCTQNSGSQTENPTFCYGKSTLRSGNNTTVQNTTVQESIDTIQSSAPASGEKLNAKSIVDLFNRLCPSLPKVISLTDARKTGIKKAAEFLGGVENFEAFFKRIEQSDFLTGRNKVWLNCGFDWCLKKGNLVKICEGQYDNKGVTATTEPELSEYEEMVAGYIPTYRKKGESAR